MLMFMLDDRVTNMKVSREVGYTLVSGEYGLVLASR